MTTFGLNFIITILRPIYKTGPKHQMLLFQDKTEVNFPTQKQAVATEVAIHLISSKVHTARELTQALPEELQDHNESKSSCNN